MRRLDDEILMAYADGALSAADARRVEAELERDAAARRMVTLFRSTAALARHAYDWPMWSETPPRLVGAIERARTRALRLHAWPTWLGGWPGFGGLAAVAAASLAVLVAAGTIPWPPGPDRRETTQSNGTISRVAVGKVPVGSELAGVLDHLTGLAPGPQRRGYSLVATLSDKWGNTCQEVDAQAQTPDGPPAFVFVACRPAGGDWTVVGAVSPLIMIDGVRCEAYVRSEAAAHEALSSVLAMIGARQRASALKPETKQQ